MKTCIRCSVEKELSEYYAFNKMADGHLKVCKQCKNLESKEYRKNNREKLRQFERTRRLTPERKAQSKKATPLHRSRYPEKYKARGITTRAILTGKLIKGACLGCGSMFTEAHHPDYSLPLEVEWYCRQCHPKESA